MSKLDPHPRGRYHFIPEDGLLQSEPFEMDLVKKDQGPVFLAYFRCTGMLMVHEGCLSQNLFKPLPISSDSPHPGFLPGGFLRKLKNQICCLTLDARTYKWYMVVSQSTAKLNEDVSDLFYELYVLEACVNILWKYFFKKNRHLFSVY